MNQMSQYRSTLQHQIHPNHCPPLQNFPARFTNPSIPDNVNALMISQMANDGSLQYHNGNIQQFVIENRHLNTNDIVKDVHRVALKQENRDNFQQPVVPMNVERPQEVRTAPESNEVIYKPTPTINSTETKFVHCNMGSKNCALCYKGQQSGKIMVDATTMTDNDEMDQAAGWTCGEDSGSKVAEYLSSLRHFLKLSATGGKRRLGNVRIMSTADGTRLYCCPECHMAYPDKSLLEPHLAAHKIERRFICNVCGAGMKRKEHLDRHALSHTEERPYRCDSCPKTFKRNEHLARHAIVHSGQKSQVCTECGKSFFRKDHLRKHYQGHLTKRLRMASEHS